MKDAKNLLFLRFYPDLMNLYGSYANILVLRRLWERLGFTVTVRDIAPGEDLRIADLSKADFIYMGAGTERRQKFAMDDFIRYADFIKQAASDGIAMLFAGNSMELCGQSVTPYHDDQSGGNQSYNGIGLAGFSTVQQSRRITGDVYGYYHQIPPDSRDDNHDTEAEPYRIPVVGFMNKSGVISGVETPLLNSLEMGFGNERDKGPEGFQRDHVFGSELTGPLLVKNPRLLEKIAAAMGTRGGLALPDEWPVDTWAEKGYAVTVRELDARCHKR